MVAFQHFPEGRTMESAARSEKAAPARQAKEEWAQHPTLTLTAGALCDLELLQNGGFAPLTAFMGQADYQSVLQTMRLADGRLFPLPVTLDIDEHQLRKVENAPAVLLTDGEGFPLALLEPAEIWRPDRMEEARLCYGSTDIHHPGVARLLQDTPPYCLAGPLRALALPRHYDFLPHRHTPAELRNLFARLGWTRVVAFQTRNPMHRAHRELAVRACAQTDAKLLIHPAVGLTKPGDIDPYTRVRCALKILPHFPHGMAMLSLLPLAMRMAGPREALLHGLIRANYGCSHFIVGRDHAGPGNDENGKPFYPPYAAQELLAQHQRELAITLVPFQRMVYLEERAAYLPENELPPGTAGADISGSELRRRLNLGLPIPEWFSYPEVVEELRRARPERCKQGFTVFFTGLSGAGKSTLAAALEAALLEEGSRPITLLDGDVVRSHLSSELGFSREHRDLNIRRIGFVAAEITKHRGIAICAPIAPFAATRRAVRQMVEANGGFIEIHVATSLAECERRDRKGLYAKARQGLLRGFTGIDDPYEEPLAPELRLDTQARSVAECLAEILLLLQTKGYLG